MFLLSDIWSSLRAYYYNNFNSFHLEFENSAVVNKNEKHTEMIDMPPQLKRYWQSRLRGECYITL